MSTRFALSCRAQEVLSSLGIKSSWRFGEDTGSKQKVQHPAPENTAPEDQNRHVHEDAQPENCLQEPDPKRQKTDSSAPADVSAAVADASSAAAVSIPADVSTAAAGASAACIGAEAVAEEGSAHAETEATPPVRVFDVARQRQNEVRASYRSHWGLLAINASMRRLLISSWPLKDHICD